MITPFLPVYRRSDLAIVRGEGVYLYGEDGRRYLDFAAGVAVTSLGHCHPHLVAALTKQAETLWLCSNFYQVPELTRFADRLVNATFADTVFFCNSGAEAVECGIKMIRRHFSAAGQPERFRIITFAGGFHGRTMAAISAAPSARTAEGYGPLLDGFDQVAYDDIDAVRRAITPATAGILVEPVQGDGGIRVPSQGFLRALRQLADEHGLLLFCDEIQSGMGRTGSLFAFEHEDITPDIAASAKGIGNGFPLAACLATEHAAKGMTPGSHGSTYGSNPLAMAVGNAVLDIMLAPDFLPQVREVAALLNAELQKLVADYPEVVRAIRGKGLMLGVQCIPPAMEVVSRLRAAGLLTAPAEENVVRILPPLIINESHVNEAISIMRTCFGEW